METYPVAPLGLALSALQWRTLAILLLIAPDSLKVRKGCFAMSCRNDCMSSGGIESITDLGIERLGRSCDHARSSTLPFAILFGVVVLW